MCDVAVRILFPPVSRLSFRCDLAAAGAALNPTYIQGELAKRIVDKQQLKVVFMIDNLIFLEVRESVVCMVVHCVVIRLSQARFTFLQEMSKVK